MWEILCLRHFWEKKGKNVPIKVIFQENSGWLKLFHFGLQVLLRNSHFSPTYALSPLPCICTYINISDLLQIPISISNSCYWSVHGQEILSLPRDRRWSRYPVKVHSSLLPTKAYFMWKCLTASSGEPVQKLEFYRCYHGRKQCTCWEINPPICF